MSAKPVPGLEQQLGWSSFCALEQARMRCAQVWQGCYCPAARSVHTTHICVQDAVPRTGKFIVLYKRGGHRVILNGLGDCIVRPSPLEASLRQIPAGA